MNFAQFSLRNRYTIYALIIAMVVFGTIAYLSLPIQLFPDTAPPLVNVLTPYPGAAAGDVADMVSDRIERECASLEGVYKVTSTSQDGLSLVSIEFKYDISVDLAAIDVQNALSRIRSILPRDIAEPQILKFSTSNRPVLTMGLKGENLVAVRRLARDVLAPELQRVSGVAMVDIFGGYEPEISVQVDRAKLEAHHLPLSWVIETIRSHNVSLPAGQIRSNRIQYTFRVDEQSRNLADIAGLMVKTPSGKSVRISDIATVNDGKREDLSRYRVHGQAAIAMQIFKQDDANTVSVVEKLQVKFRDLADRYPDVTFIEAEESATFTRLVVDNMFASVWQALLLATIIIFLFLGSFKRGLVVAISMPMAFLLTFAGMKVFSIEVNMVTLTAIILAIGMVVDSSVVILENITRHHREKKKKLEEAAVSGTAEIQFSVIAGTMTTLIVLVPLLFLYGFVGKTFGPLAATLILAFLSSLMVALLIVPLLTVLVSRKDGRMEKAAKRITRPWDWLMNQIKSVFMVVLSAALHVRWLVIIIALLLFAGGLVILRFQGSELLPQMDGGSSFVTVETPSRSSLDETEKVVQAIEDIILNEPEVEKISTQIGFEPGMHSFGGGGVQGPTNGLISITFTPRTTRVDSIWTIQDRLREKMAHIPGIQNSVIRESGSTAKSTTASSIVVSIRGEDTLVLDILGTQVLSALKSVPGVTNPYRSWRRDKNSVVLTLDEERSSDLNISPMQIAHELRQSLDGMEAGALRTRLGEETPILVRYDHSYRKYKEDLFTVRTISSSNGSFIPIGALVKEYEITVPGLVTRENMQPTLQVLALHQNRPLNFVTADIRKTIKQINIPRGYSLGLEGEEKDMVEARQEIIGALFVALMAIYLLLVTQFRSFLIPLIVLFAVPLSVIGVSFGLWLGDKPVSMPVLVGLILLLGIVVNNSIILIDFIQQRQDQGIDRRTALLESVAIRFRPIMMTFLSTFVGMLPLALEWALGAEKFSPLAIAVMGGMTASTVLTMIVIPVLYDVVEDLRMRFSVLWT